MKYQDIIKYEEFYNNVAHGFISHYFRVLYNTIKYIDRHENLDDSQKEKYVHLLRAQISSHELYFIFYSGLSGYGKENFKALLEKYAFFEHLHNEITITNLKAYDSKAYGSNSYLLKYVENYEKRELLPKQENSSKK